MTARSLFRGFPIYWSGNEWRFAHTNEPTVQTWKDLPCGHCGLHATTEGHDGCLGELPGVKNACCGHGSQTDAYIQFPDGSIERGQDAINLMHRLIQEIAEELQ